MKAILSTTFGNMFFVGLVFAVLIVIFPGKVYAQNTELPITGPQSQKIFLAQNQKTPQVTGRTEYDITELPKTGIPLALWGLAALLPLGNKLRKRGLEKEVEITPHSIWLRRELDK